MGAKVEAYRQALRQLDDWEPYLLAESGLPGPRGNLELAEAAAREAAPEQLNAWLELDSERAPTGTAQEFLAFCGVRGQGRLLAEGQRGALSILRRSANDPRWRVREAVAIALQDYGKVDRQGLIGDMQTWITGDLFEQRAACAALCEPCLLDTEAFAGQVLELLDRVTDGVAEATERRSDGFRALRQALGYCWSVAAAALPRAGKAYIEKWLAHPDRDVHWIMLENLKKKRLERMDFAWVQAQLNRKPPGPPAHW
jgi:hypothetical protein